MYPENELRYVRDLAKEVVEFAKSDEMAIRRELWSDHNSLRFTRPPVYVRSIPFDEFTGPENYRCTDRYLRSIEKFLLVSLYRKRVTDDFIVEPFVAVRAAKKAEPGGIFGVNADIGILTLTAYGMAAEPDADRPPAAFGRAHTPPLASLEDINKLQYANYAVDEEETARRVDRMSEALGGIIEVGADRQGELCAMWHNDISTLLARLRGEEQIMWDIYDNPEWLHRLLSFMRDSVLKNMEQTERAGGFSLLNHQNQSMPYARELSPPSADSKAVLVSELWGYLASQEFTGIGPAHFEEFMLRYQIPIIERYGLAAYGCCEDLSKKNHLLKQIPNLRRIAVSPFADMRSCAELIGRDYIASYRPNPSSAVSFGVDETFVRSSLREAFEVFDSEGCAFDITLKDVETVSSDGNAIIKWSDIVRDEINRRYGN